MISQYSSPTVLNREKLDQDFTTLTNNPIINYFLTYRVKKVGLKDLKIYKEGSIIRLVWMRHRKDSRIFSKT